MLRSLLAVVTAVGMPVSLVAGPPTDPLEGTWTQVATLRDGKVKSELADPYTLTVKGDAISLRHGDRLIWAGRIKRLGGSVAGPEKFDLAFDRTKGTLKPLGDGPAYGLLEIRGDELRMSSSQGRNELVRPKDLSGAGSRTVFTWHRIP